MKHYILSFIIACMPAYGWAQKITLGSCQTRDKGEYKGEMVAGKPHGKGKTTYQHGNRYGGE